MNKKTKCGENTSKEKIAWRYCMIKGCSRKVIVVKNPGSDLFEEAYFIVSPKESERRYGDFLLEANRIIQSKTVSHGRNQREKSVLLPVLAGFLTGAAVAFPTALFLF